MDSEPKGAPVRPDQKPKIEETLEPGQNFYDQAPFRRIIAEAAGTHANIDLANVRKLLTLLARMGDPTYSAGEVTGQELTTRQLADKIRNPYDPDSRQAFKSAKVFYKFDPDYFSVMGEIAEKLAKFPFWHNYVNGQIHATYATDGSYPSKSREKIPSIPDSYARYIVIKTGAQRTGILKGIGEVFDQRATDLAQGKSRPAREWAQRAAAETTRPK